ncbi:MAG: hypothetical protein GX180_10035 [Enterococcus sp.]|nr:hypothetical protein [Enterococcus sp.]
MRKAELYSDLDWIENKFSFNQLFELFYTLARVRYATPKQLQPLNHRVATKTNLVKFCESGYLDGVSLVKNETAFYITDKTKQILANEGFNVKVLQKDFTGQTLTHPLKITDCILKLQGEEHFYNVFYPVFREAPKYDKEFLRPDFCVVLKKKSVNIAHYKIEFCEVETEKPDWLNYLLIKKEKYEKLATDKNLYSLWWKVWAGKLNLPMCKEKDFCFSVRCFGNIKRDWEGWQFNELA